MPPRLPISTRRRRRSGGNSLVEGAFTILPTFALIFGFLDFGIMFFRWETLQNAVREGVRYAVTFQTFTDPVTHAASGQNASIQRVVQTNAMGLVKTNDNPATIFVKYYTQSAPTTEVTTGGNVPGNIVEVWVSSPLYSWIAPLSGSYSSHVASTRRNATPLRFNVHAFDILGGYPVGVTSVTP
jgi:Flp pilus assembly protein TadG